MAAPWLGGFAITDMRWMSLRALRVDFTSTYGASYCYQLYAGRSLIGWTETPAERSVTGQLVPTEYPQQIQLLAVAPISRTTDYGSLLPRRPYNRAKLSFTTTGWPTDAKLIEVSAGTEPGGSVDPDNVIAKQLFTADGAFSILTPVMPGSGTWNFGVRGRDNRPTVGNAGDALELSADLLTHPPDVVLQTDNSRFSVEVSGGVATISFELPG